MPKWDLPPLQSEPLWDLNCYLSPALPGCSHLEFLSLLYSWIKNTGKITEAIHKKKKWSHLRVTLQSLEPALASFHILCPPRLQSLHGTQEHCGRALPWWAKTFRDISLCHFLLLKHFCSASELLMLPGLWCIVIFFLQDSCHHFYSLFKLNLVLIKGPGRLFSYPLWESILQNT